MQSLCWQVAAAHNLMENTRKTVEGRAKLGIEAFAQALLGIPKILAENSGYDAQETIIKLQVVLIHVICKCRGWHGCDIKFLCAFKRCKRLRYCLMPSALFLKKVHAVLQVYAHGQLYFEDLKSPVMLLNYLAQYL